MTEEQENDNNTTTDPSLRHPYTNDIITGFLVLNGAAAFWAILYGVYSGAIPVGDLTGALGNIYDPLIGQAIGALILSMAIWLYGDGIIDAYKRLRG
jgi:hypothetical protein